MRSDMDFKMRLFRIDQMIHDQGPVSFDVLQKALHCSAPTLKRDLHYLRNELKAPIVYSYKHNGYFYSDTDGKPDKVVLRKEFMLPATWYSPTEMVALLVALDLFDKVQEEGDGLLAGEMKSMKARLLSLIQDNKLQARELHRRLKMVTPQLKAYRNPFFEVIGSALAHRMRLNVTYYSKSRKTANERELSPLRLVNYKNRWYLDAWCHTSDALKTFSLDNVRSAQLLTKRCKLVAMRDVVRELDQGYGLFSGKVVQRAHIEIDDVMAVYVKDEIWHKDQEMILHDDGTLTLSVPYAQETELIGQILKLGTHAHVTGPASLCDSVKHELRGMLKFYAEK